MIRHFRVSDLHWTGASAIIMTSTTGAGGAWGARRGGGTGAGRPRAAGTRWAGPTWGTWARTWAAAWSRARSRPGHVQNKKNEGRKGQKEISSEMHCVCCMCQWMHVCRTSENKPAAAAAGRSTAAFPYFLASSLLVSILGSSLVFTSVFCFFLFLPLCGWRCPKDKARR